MAFADEVTVLRRGRVGGRGLVSELDAATMAEMMMGAGAHKADAIAAGASDDHLAATSASPAKSSPSPRLRVDGLGALDDLGVPAINGVSLDVFGGEIVGVAAIAGNGQEELVEVLAGQRRKTAGRVLVNGLDYQGTRDEIRAQKVRCLPEDPLRSACVPNMSVAENLALRDFDQAPFARARWALSPGRLLGRARTVITEYGIRARGPETPIGQLSGGNVQRVVLARELAGDVGVLIAANPCMGLDFKAVAEIHRRLREARDRGVAVLLVSADLDEVLALADRVLVMSDGHIVHETRPAAADVRVIGKFMAGHAHGGDAQAPEAA
jgi:ABC-type uncharacterized transport system ATPase subunit